MVEPRPVKPTVQFVDEYCQWYQPLFPEVRSFEAFKQLHLGVISAVNRKSLPAIAQIAGLDNAQSLQHFLTESPWQSQHLRQQRLQLILAITIAATTVCGNQQMLAAWIERLTHF